MNIPTLFKSRKQHDTYIDQMLKIVAKMHKIGLLTDEPSNMYIWNLRTYEKEQIRQDTSGHELPVGNCFLIGLGYQYIRLPDCIDKSQVPLVELYTDGINIIHKNMRDETNSHTKTFLKFYKQLKDLCDKIKVDEIIPSNNQWLKGVFDTFNNMTENDRYRHLVYIRYNP